MFQTLKQDILNRISDVHTELQRRKDLFNNLSNVITSYINFEKSTYENVTEKRGRAKAMSEISNMPIEQIPSYINAVAEQYPGLKAYKEYTHLVSSLIITENRINDARRIYNETINPYNVLATTFPTNMVAFIFRFKVYEYYGLEDNNVELLKS